MSKDLTQAVQTGSFNERSALFEKLEDTIRKDDVPEAAIKAVCKIVPVTIPRYVDARSRELVTSLLEILLGKHGSAAFPHVASMLAEIAGSWVVSDHPSKSSARHAFTAFQWTEIALVQTVNILAKFSKEDVAKVFSAQGTFYAVVCFGGHHTIRQKAEETLKKLWQEHPELLKAATTYLSTAALTPRDLIYASSVFLKANKAEGVPADVLKANLLDAFIKNVVSSRTRPSPHITENCSPLLKSITHDEFKSSLFPAIQKALLRSPEIILECVAGIFNSLTIDMSNYAGDLAKTLGACLHAKEDRVRDDTVLVCESLSRQCSEPGSVEKLLNTFFAVYNGSEGKLTVTAHKISVIQGIGKLSQNCVPASQTRDLSKIAAEHFMKVLKSEVHEGTNLVCIQEMHNWCNRGVDAEMGAKVVQFLVDGMNAKTATSNIRNGYIKLMRTCCVNSDLKVDPKVVQILVKCIEKATTASGQIANVTEGVSAACLLLELQSLGKCDTSTTLLGQPFWDAVSGKNASSPFFSDRFILQASPETQYTLLLMCERLATEHETKVEANLLVLMRAILMVLFRWDYKWKTKAAPTVRRLVKSLRGPFLVKSLLSAFSAFLNENPAFVSSDAGDKSGDAPKKEGGTESADYRATSIRDTMLLLARECRRVSLDEDSKKEAEYFALQTLVPAHHPALFNIRRNFWEQVCDQLGLSARMVLSERKEEVIPMMTAEFGGSDSEKNALTTLARLCPEGIIHPVVTAVAAACREPKYYQVTDEECAIYATPAGTLWKRSLIDALREENILNAKNMKRESKAYSYKDQMEELELKKELNKKRKKEDLSDLTPKQREIVKLELEREEGIRLKLEEVRTSFVKGPYAQLESFLEGDKHEFSKQLVNFLPDLLKLLKSPLIAGLVVDIYAKLRFCVFTDKRDQVMGETIAFVTLRVLKPRCDLNREWAEEPLQSAGERAIAMLFDDINHNRKSEPEIDEDGTLVEQKLVPVFGPRFTYSFPLIKAMFGPEGDGMWLKGGEQLLVTALRILETYSAQADESLPVKEMLSLLLHIVGERDGAKAQQVAIQVLNHVGRALSGENGCALLSPTELRVFLAGMKHRKAIVRDASVRALGFSLEAFLKTIRNRKGVVDAQHERILMELTERMWVCKFDPSEEVAGLAKALFHKAKLHPSPLLIERIIDDISCRVPDVREGAATALAELLKSHSSFIPQTLEKLLETYQEHLAMTPPVTDSFGRVIEPPRDLWESRVGIALAIGELASQLDADSVVQLMSFFVREGLGDREPIVGKAMLKCALTAVEAHGKAMVNQLLPLFENLLEKAPNTEDFDNVRQGVVILMGSLARHLDPRDAKVTPILGKLIHALSTPSEQVQEAVASCLPPLVSALGSDAETELVNRLLDLLLESDDYGERRGSAYGLAGIVKGLGILSLKQKNIMIRLTDAIQDKKNHKHREGALLAFEQLCSLLGRLFEPYIVHVLPHLLLCFGDLNQYVREAAEECAKAVMGKLSAHGVKLVLPSLIAALQEDSWRTKTGSVELLGAMAYCAPKQLSSCLPNIVPRLIEVLGDSHPRVQQAGTQALKQIGSVIRNPEIQALVPILLESLEDPTKKTAVALTALLETQFVHAIDAPSLALIMPVVQRAFLDRSTETRKMSAQIIGNMYSLTDSKDLMPYLPSIIPGLKNSLRDPVPEVRSVSARALGAMVRGMGESSFEDLLPWLMQTLTSESGAVDRSGAAQGLAEVVGGLGVEKLQRLMPDIIATAQRGDIAPHVKDGYMMLFIYFPSVFKQEFTPYIGEIVHPILKALADESEYVRATALKAGQRIINTYADSAIALLLPELERGLFHDNWRIRFSSVQLLGDLLYRISGVTGKMSTESAGEDDNFGTEYSHKAILDALGDERRNRVLAGLYMGRSDTAVMVRQSALHVWKVVVSNTPRTLREILPTLFSVLLGCLASNSADKKQIAARTLGDLVRKLGERVLPEIMPILEKGLRSPHADQRQGVCIGLSEIMASTSRDMVLAYVDNLVPTVRRALADELPEVRHAAARTFDSLHTTVGNRALDDILKPMLDDLNDPKVGEYTLDGLRHVMAVKSRVVLPYLVPQLTSHPVNTKALSALASVAGEALSRHLPKIIPALLDALAAAIEAEGADVVLHKDITEQCQAVLLPVTDETGVRSIVDILLEDFARKLTSRGGLSKAKRAAAGPVVADAKADAVKETKCVAAVILLSGFCVRTKVDMSQFVPQLMRGLLYLFAEKNQVLLQCSYDALAAVTKHLDAKAQVDHVYDLRQAIKFVASDLLPGELLPGFCLPKGVAPILPILRESILNGTPEQKEQAAAGMGEIIRLTSLEALKPSVVSITGPLIRVLSDRFAYTLKVEVLVTLTLLMDKVGQQLKAFLPQLQTTFLRALNDPNRIVRLKAGLALASLMKTHTRGDPLFVELHTTIKNGGDDQGVRDTCLQALRNIVGPCGDKVSPAMRKSLVQTLVGLLSNAEDQTRSGAAGCLGAIAKWMEPDERKALFSEYLLDDDKSKDWMLKHGCALALSACLKESPETLVNEEYERKVPKALLSHLSADRVPLVISAVQGCGFLIAHCVKARKPIPVDIISPFAKLMNHTANEVKVSVATMTVYLWFVARENNIHQQKPQNGIVNGGEGDEVGGAFERASGGMLLPASFIKPVVPMLVNGTKEKNALVKSTSEAALSALLEIHLPGSEAVQQDCMKMLDAGAGDALADVVTKLSRKKEAPERPREDEIDMTLLT